jgi:hypothetical protein
MVPVGTTEVTKTSRRDGILQAKISGAEEEEEEEEEWQVMMMHPAIQSEEGEVHQTLDHYSHLRPNRTCSMLR